MIRLPDMLTTTSKNFNCKYSNKTKCMPKIRSGPNNNSSNSPRFTTREMAQRSNILPQGQMLEGNQEIKRELKHREYLRLVGRKRAQTLEELMIIMFNINSLLVALTKDRRNFRPTICHKMRMLTWSITPWLPKAIWAKQISISTTKMKKKTLEKEVKTWFKTSKILHPTQSDLPRLKTPIRFRFWKNSSCSYNNSNSRNTINKEVEDRVLDRINKICQTMAWSSRSKGRHRCKVELQSISKVEMEQQGQELEVVREKRCRVIQISL